MRLLFLLANTVGGEASLTQLTKEVGISKSKGLAILNTLRSAGLVVRDERTKNYSLGPNLLLLSRALINNTDLARAARPYLEALAAKTGCSLHLGVISGETLFVVARAHAPGGSYIPIDVGHRYPLTWGAHGRAYLATLPPEELDRRLSRSSVIQAGETDRDQIDRDTLRAQVEEARRVGYGSSVGTTWSGLNAVSAVLGAPGAGYSRGPEHRRLHCGRRLVLARARRAHWGSAGRSCGGDEPTTRPVAAIGQSALPAIEASVDVGVPGFRDPICRERMR